MGNSNNQKLPSYMNGIIKENLYNFQVLQLTELIIKESLESSPYFQRKIKTSTLDCLIRNKLKDHGGKDDYRKL